MLQMLQTDTYLIPSCIDTMKGKFIPQTEKGKLIALLVTPGPDNE